MEKMFEHFIGRTFIVRVDATDIGSIETTAVSDIAFLAQRNVRPILITPNADIASSWVRCINRNANVAVGLSGVDAALLPAAHADQLGAVQTGLLATLTAAGYVPVIQPTALSLSGKEIAVDPDAVACAIAVATEAARVIFFDAAGGVIDPQTHCLLNELTPAEALTLAESPELDLDLRATIRAAARGVRAGIEAAQILDGRISHATIIEMLTSQHLGTQVAGSVYIS